MWAVCSDWVGVKGLLVAWLGNSAHLWMWDEKSMMAALHDVGFKRIRRASFGDAEDRKFAEVEDPDRFEGCLAIECSR
jgi:hypothetical protein